MKCLKYSSSKILDSQVPAGSICGGLVLINSGRVGGRTTLRNKFFLSAGAEEYTTINSTIIYGLFVAYQPQSITAVQNPEKLRVRAASALHKPRVHEMPEVFLLENTLLSLPGTCWEHLWLIGGYQ